MRRYSSKRFKRRRISAKRRVYNSRKGKIRKIRKIRAYRGGIRL